MKKILFVCTGNTCRSPMAQAVFNNLCDSKYFSSDSCGLYADGVSMISDNAKAALKNQGIDFDHVSKPITKELCDNADFIIGITNRHAGALMVAFPGHEKKVFSFPVDIPDPYGMSLEVYQECLEKITEGVKVIIHELEK